MNFLKFWELIALYQNLLQRDENNHVDEDESKSSREWEKRLNKSFELDLDFLQSIMKTKLKQADFDRLAHLSISIANE